MLLAIRHWGKQKASASNKNGLLPKARVVRYLEQAVAALVGVSGRNDHNNLQRIPSKGRRKQAVNDPGEY